MSFRLVLHGPEQLIFKGYCVAQITSFQDWLGKLWNMGNMEHALCIATNVLVIFSIAMTKHHDKDKF